MQSPRTHTPFRNRWFRWMQAAVVTLPTLTACAIPEYRLTVNNIPAGATELRMAAFLLGMTPDTYASPQEQVSTPIPANRTSLSTTISLGPNLGQPTNTVFGVVARDGAGCILATGETTPAQPSASVTDIALQLAAIHYPTAAPDRCRSDGPIIADVLRQERGVFGRTDFHLLIRGWGFLPSDMNQVFSEFPIPDGQCRFSSCTARCTGTVDPCSPPPGFSGTTCRSHCSMVSTLEYVAPTLAILHLPEDGNVVSNTPPPKSGLAISDQFALSTLRASPFSVTMTRADGTSPSTYTEQEPPKE